MSDLFNNPGERLLFAIGDSDMTQRKFAELIGMSPNGLNAIVKGKKRLSRILALATEQITGVEANWILNEEQPMRKDPLRKIDPWDRMIIEFKSYNVEHEFFVNVFNEIDQQSGPFRNSIDPKIAWSEEQIRKYIALINEAKRIIDFFMHLGVNEGQGPYRLGLMIMYGEFSEEQLNNSSAALFTDEKRHPSIDRIREIRLELDDLINKPNTKGD